MDRQLPPPEEEPSREAIRFLADVGANAPSTTVSRYQRLHFSRRRGNAIRADLLAAGLIEPVAIATRSGQVVLHQLTDAGRSVCARLGIEPGPPPRASLEHGYWVERLAVDFEGRGYRVTREYAVPDDGIIDLLAENDRERVAIEVETGKSDIAENLRKLAGRPFDRIIFVATSPAAIAACTRAMDSAGGPTTPRVELQTWLDLE